jgi:hypothetical protein
MIEKIKENKALTEPGCWRKSGPKYRRRARRGGGWKDNRSHDVNELIAVVWVGGGLKDSFRGQDL